MFCNCFIRSVVEDEVKAAVILDMSHAGPTSLLFVSGSDMARFTEAIRLKRSSGATSVYVGASLLSGCEVQSVVCQNLPACISYPLAPPHFWGHFLPLDKMCVEENTTL